MSSNIYRVVIKGGEGLRIDTGSIDINIKERPNDSMKVSTEEVDEGFDCLVPRCLLFDCLIHEDNLRSAVNRAMSHAQFVARNISFASNAYHGEITPHVAYDATPGKAQRRFWQSWRQQQNSIPSIPRFVPIKLVVTISEALDQSLFRKRIEMAIDHYVGALSHWRDGHELLALSRLFMASEALSIARVKRLMHDLKYETREDLANYLGIKKTKDIESWVRKEIVFKDEHVCHQRAKAASDAFEHGFGDFGQMRNYSVEIVERTAFILRRGILDSVEINDNDKQKLLTNPYHVPKTIGGWTGACTGYLHGDGEELAQEKQKYPFIEFDFQLVSLKKDDKEFTMVIQPDTVNAILHKNIEFSQVSMDATDNLGYGFLPEE